MKIFLGAVIQGVESGALSYTYAFNLLDGSAKLFDYFQEEFMGYEDKYVIDERSGYQVKN